MSRCSTVASPRCPAPGELQVAVTAARARLGEAASLATKQTMTMVGGSVHPTLAMLAALAALVGNKQSPVSSIPVSTTPRIHISALPASASRSPAPNL